MNKFKEGQWIKLSMVAVFAMLIPRSSGNRKNDKLTPSQKNDLSQVDQETKTMQFTDHQ